MHDSPRIRRLRSDLGAMTRLSDESTVLDFRTSGTPAQDYRVGFQGKSLAKFRGKVSVLERHEVEIKLGAGYPRTMPEIRWVTPIYHPNISEIGMVCLGGYGTHWVPSLNLDELCVMLWDMARYHNYDVRSPYNREAALWVAYQTNFTFPLDPRPLRDLRAALGRVEGGPVAFAPESEPPKGAEGAALAGTMAGRFVRFLRRSADEREAAPVVAGERPAAESSRVADEEVVLLEPGVDDERAPAGRPEAPRLRAADAEILFLD